VLRHATEAPHLLLLREQAEKGVEGDEDQVEVLVVQLPCATRISSPPGFSRSF
jgi:hypothetical protein